MKSVLFVCLGNICRSPAAEEILRQAAKKRGIEVYTESCGLGDWHTGQLPDQRMRQAAEGRGYTLISRAQPVSEGHLEAFDLVLAADHKVKEELLKRARRLEHKQKIYLMTSFSKQYKDHEIPDPYFGGSGGFEEVLDMLEEAIEGLVSNLERTN